MTTFDTKSKVLLYEDKTGKIFLPRSGFRGPKKKSKGDSRIIVKCPTCGGGGKYSYQCFGLGGCCYHSINNAVIKKIPPMKWHKDYWDYISNQRGMDFLAVLRAYIEICMTGTKKNFEKRKCCELCGDPKPMMVASSEEVKNVIFPSSPMAFMFACKRCKNRAKNDVQGLVFPVEYPANSKLYPDGYKRAFFAIQVALQELQSMDASCQRAQELTKYIETLLAFCTAENEVYYPRYMKIRASQNAISYKALTKRFFSEGVVLFPSYSYTVVEKGVERVESEDDDLAENVFTEMAIEDMSDAPKTEPAQEPAPEPPKSPELDLQVTPAPSHPVPEVEPVPEPVALRTGGQEDHPIVRPALPPVVPSDNRSSVLLGSEVLSDGTRRVYLKPPNGSIPKKAIDYLPDGTIVERDVEMVAK